MRHRTPTHWDSLLTSVLFIGYNFPFRGRKATPAFAHLLVPLLSLVASTFPTQSLLPSPSLPFLLPPKIVHLSSLKDRTTRQGYGLYQLSSYQIGMHWNGSNSNDPRPEAKVKAVVPAALIKRP